MGDAPFLYDAEDVIAEYDGALLLREFVHGPGYDEPLMIDRNLNTDTTAVDPIYDVRLFYVHDALGSVVALENTAERHVEGYLYDAYGEAYIINAGTDGVLMWGQDGSDDFLTAWSAYDNPYTYTSQRADPETGLMYYKAHYYDPEQGRFISRDPIGIWTDSVNLGNGYAYGGNRPYSGRDPSGEAWHLLVGAAVGAIAGAGTYAVKQATCGDCDWTWGDFGQGAGGGAVAGFLISTGNPMFLSAGVGIGTEIMFDTWDDGSVNRHWSDYALSAGTAMAGGGAGTVVFRAVTHSLAKNGLAGVMPKILAKTMGAGAGAGAAAGTNLAGQGLQVAWGVRCDVDEGEELAAALGGGLGGILPAKPMSQWAIRSTIVFSNRLRGKANWPSNTLSGTTMPPCRPCKPPVFPWQRNR